VGAIYTYISDTPACDVLGFRLNISTLKYHVSGTTDNFASIFPTQSTFVSLRMDFVELRDTSTIMYLSSMNVGQYDRADLIIQLPKIVLYDPAQDPPIRVIDGELSTASPQIPISPPLSMSDTTLNVVRLDFDVAKSLQFDSTGQVTKNVIPVFSATPLPQAADKTFGTFDNIVGFVTQVSPAPTGAFIGTFTMQLHGGTGQAVPISIKADTALVGTPDLKSLETGRVVEVLATVDSSGNIVADRVEVEDRAVIEEKRASFFGTVLPTPVTDAGGNVTQFKLYLRRTEPDRSADIPLDEVLTVNVPSNAVFRVSPRPANLTPLEFGPTSLTVGQEVLVHGQYTVTSGQPTVVDATSLYLRPQAIQGSLSSLISVASDGRSGAFWLAGCATLLQTTPIIVMTTNVDTTFLDVFGLSEINPQKSLLVRGFPFFVKNATVVRGVPIPAGTLVLFASQVRQLP
jgi:hypothetical protein